MLQSTQKIIRYKVGLLNLAEELGNVSKACQMMGLSRDTFYRYRDAVEEGGVEALLDKNPDPSETEVRYWLAGNLCRCTGYDKVVRAVLDAAADMRGS